MINSMYLVFILLMMSIESSRSINCSVICGKYPSEWCCPDGYVCYGTRQCQISYSGNRAWMLVLRTIAPIVVLMIIVIVIAYLQHKKDPTGQMQSRSIHHHSLTTSNTIPSSQSEGNSQIFRIFLPQHSFYQI